MNLIESKISCPKCGTTIPLTETLAAPLLTAKEKEIRELNEYLRQNDLKLKAAQTREAEFIRRERELEHKKREIELTIEKTVSQRLTALQHQVQRDLEDQYKLKLSEKDIVITSMQTKIADLQKKSEQGSQQLQGEVLEIELEKLLKNKFPYDLITPVPKGEYGGDIVHSVKGSFGQDCGSILWESKHTKNWHDKWISKLKDDQRAAKADLAVLISMELPRDTEQFDFVDGVWIAHPRTAVPLAFALRQSLIELANLRKSIEGRQTKTDLIYQYFTGNRFRQRVQAIVEAFSTMKEDLDKEKKAIVRQWAKREEQIERVIEATVTMYGELQGIAGQSLPEIKELGFQTMITG